MLGVKGKGGGCGDGGGGMECVRLLLEAQADVNYKDSDGDTALIIACETGLRGVADTLLEANADPNACSKGDGNFPLLYAAFQGQPLLVKSLLEARATPSRANRTLSCALHYAADGGCGEAVELLIG